MAIDSAVRAFEVTRKMTSSQRAIVLRKVADGIAARREEFARTICQEAGKPIKTSRIEVERAISTFQIAAEESTRIYGEYIPLDTLESTSGRWGLVRRFPLGPVFAITPFNFPLNLVAHKVAPAMAAGLSAHSEAGAADAHLVVAAGRDCAGVGMAGGRIRGHAACPTKTPPCWWPTTASSC